MNICDRLIRTLRPSTITFIVSALFFVAPTLTFAKDLTGRMGLGYNAQFTPSMMSNGAPAISVKYGFAPRSMIEALASFHSGTSSSSVIAIKYMSTLHAEQYANFYFLLGAGLVSANQRNGNEILGGLGAEFFIPGVDSIGISFETGVAIENLTATSYILKTFGASFLQAGMHFYF